MVAIPSFKTVDTLQRDLVEQQGKYLTQSSHHTLLSRIRRLGTELCCAQDDEDTQEEERIRTELDDLKRRRLDAINRATVLAMMHHVLEEAKRRYQEWHGREPTVRKALIAGSRYIAAEPETILEEANTFWKLIRIIDEPNDASPHVVEQIAQLCRDTFEALHGELDECILETIAGMESEGQRKRHNMGTTNVLPGKLGQRIVDEP